MIMIHTYFLIDHLDLDLLLYSLSSYIVADISYPRHDEMLHNDKREADGQWYHGR